MSTYFLTGSNGFIGSHLHNKLHQLGHDIVTDMRYLHSRKYDALIHLAARTNISCEFDPELIRSNISLTEEIFKVNTRIIFGSSCSAAHLTNPYAYTKRYGEHLCGIHGNAVALRFHNVYGKGATRGLVYWLQQKSDGDKITVRGPELVRDYVFIDDVIRAILFQLQPDPIFINMEALEEAQKSVYGLKADDLIKLAFEQNIFIGDTQYIKGKPQTGVVEVGTGLPTETMGLINIYQRLSGKTFDISVEEAGTNEPKEMVSKTKIPHCIDLHEGLKRIINA